MPPPTPSPPAFGEPAPFFTAETDGIANYSIEVAAGRWIVLMVFGSLGAAACSAAHERITARRSLFNDGDAAFFGVSADPKDRFERGLGNADVGLRYFWDFDQKVCRLFGLMETGGLRPTVFLIDRSFRIALAVPIEQTDAVLDRLEAELGHEPTAPQPLAPVLELPRIFEPALCAQLVDYFRSQDPSESGFAAEVGGRTIDVVNPHFKRRQDVTVTEEAMLSHLQSILRARLLPMVRRAFGWQATEIERYLITRYSDHDQGFFSAHRDDVTAGTAHRKFAVTLNLNAEDYVGGDLRFPEFGRRAYRPPTGGATVFSCALLHEVTPVTQGVRYAFVPFLYDDAGAKLRRANLALVGEAPTGNRRDRRAARRR